MGDIKEVERAAGTRYAPVRNWLYNELNTLLPTDKVEINSRDHPGKFQLWTGYTQNGLDAIWKTEKEYRDKHDGQGPVTTTCNAFLGVVVNNARIAGKLPTSGFQSFNLSSEKGWTWYSDATVQPRTGDFFQYGQKLNPKKDENRGNWFFKHVGVIIENNGGIWTTIESGQGGPTMGYDIIRRKGPKAFNPAALMGFINVEELFAGWATD